jgi:hypothetical protein
MIHDLLEPVLLAFLLSRRFCIWVPGIEIISIGFFRGVIPNSRSSFFPFAGPSLRPDLDFFPTTQFPTLGDPRLLSICSASPILRLCTQTHMTFNFPLLGAIFRVLHSRPLPNVFRGRDSLNLSVVVFLVETIKPSSS